MAVFFVAKVYWVDRDNKGNVMKLSYKMLLGLISTLLVGIFIGAEISKQSLFVTLARHIEFETIATFSSSVVALIIAILGWRKSDKQRRGDLLHSLKEKKEEEFRRRIKNANYAKQHFRSLSRVAVLLANKNYKEVHRANGAAKFKVNQLYDGWKKSLQTADMVDTIDFIDKSDILSANLIDELERALQVANSISVSSSEKLEELDPLLEYLCDILTLVTECSTKYVEDIYIEQLKFWGMTPPRSGRFESEDIKKVIRKVEEKLDSMRKISKEM